MLNTTPWRRTSSFSLYGRGQLTQLPLLYLPQVLRGPTHGAEQVLTQDYTCFPADDVPPYFKTEPVRTQVHLEGNRLVLTCMAEGSWPLEFKWLHNNRELTRFSLEYRQVAPSHLPGASHLPIQRKEGRKPGYIHAPQAPM